jgi:hypothetical protein
MLGLEFMQGQHNQVTNAVLPLPVFRSDHDMCRIFRVKLFQLHKQLAAVAA